MAHQIEWTPQALEDFAGIVYYLETAWSQRIADSFVALTEDRLSLLSQQSFLGLRSEKQPDVRSVLLTKHNRLYYQVRENKLIILNVFNTSQDPSKNKY